jgi:hypothetical protein
LQIQWILRNSYDLCEASDSFMIGQFHIHLRGNTLIMETEDNDIELGSVAHDIALDYIGVLRKHIPGPKGLMTIEEFASLPAWANNNIILGKTTPERKRLRLGVRKARHEMLASSDPYLCQCYDFLQDAREDEDHYLVHLYKFVETLEEVFDGEAKLIRALNVRKPVKDLKDIAQTQRHAPKIGDQMKHSSSTARGYAMDWACEILATYERHIRPKTKN